MILVSQFFDVNNSIPYGSVVFDIVMLLPDNEYITYALNKMPDTGFAVLMSLLANITIPKELLERFASRRALDLENPATQTTAQIF